MPGERVKIPPRLGFPHIKVPCSIAARQQHTVRAIGSRRHPIRVLLDDVIDLAVLSVVRLERLIRRPQGNASLIRRKIRSENGIEFIADFSDFLARRHVPDQYLPALGGLPTAGKQKAAVLAEVNHIRLPRRKRQDSQHIQRLRVVEDDLVLASQSGKRGPRAARKRAERSGTRRIRHRLQRQPHRRHRRRALGLADGRRDDRHVVLLLRDRDLAPRILRRPGRDPRAEHRNLRIRQLVRLLRHERLRLVRQRLEHRAARRIARLDDFAVVAPCHR